MDHIIETALFEGRVVRRSLTMKEPKIGVMTSQNDHDSKKKIRKSKFNTFEKKNVGGVLGPRGTVPPVIKKF